VFIFMMTDLLLQSKSSGWSWPIVVLIFIISSLVLFWGPIRRLVNEWRLYRRCQKYPHIVVCKKQENSKNQKQLMTLRHLREKMERIANNVIKHWLLPIVVFLLTALGKVCGLMLDRFLAVLTFKKSSTSTDETEIPSTTQPVSAKGEQGEEEVTTTESLHGVKDNLLEFTSSLPVPGSSRKGVTQRSPKTTKYYYNIKGQSTDLYESPESSSTTEDNKHVKNKKSHDLPSEQSSYSKAYTKPSPSPPQQQQQQSLDISRGKNLTRISGSSKRKFSSPIMAATTTAITTVAMCIDSTTSLSDQMRKRRLNGGNIGVVVESRKKRRLNSSRTSVFQGVARRQTGSFWQSRKPLDKREREEREERLLRGMNRSKRTKPNDKPIIENPKLVTGTESTALPPATNQFTVAAAPTTAAASGPTFNFGQADANTSDKQGTEITAAPSPLAPVVTDQCTAAAPTQAGANTSEEKQTAPTLASKPSTAPLQFGAPQKLEAVKDSTVTDSQPAANTVVAQTVVNQQLPFAFGSGSTPASAGALAPTAVSTQVQFSTAGQGNNSVPTSQQSAPAQGITFGAPAPTAASTQVQFGTAGQGNNSVPTSQQSAPTQGSTFGNPALAAVSTQVQFGAAGQGNNSVPTSQQSAPAQGVTFGAPAPATAPAPTAGLTQNQFGSTGQFNSAAPSSQQSGNQLGAASANQSFSGFTPSPAPAAVSQQSVTQGFNQNTFGSQTSFGNTKENTNPGTFNSAFQQSSTASNGNMPTASNGLSKPDPTNGNIAPPFGMNAPAPPSFGAGIGGPVASFGAGAGGPVASSGASARRQQRRSRTRRR
jgi:hypothetical protein